VVDRVLRPPGGASSISLGGAGDRTQLSVAGNTELITGTDTGSSQPQPAGECSQVTTDEKMTATGSTVTASRHQAGYTLKSTCEIVLLCMCVLLRSCS